MAASGRHGVGAYTFPVEKVTATADFASLPGLGKSLRKSRL